MKLEDQNFEPPYCMLAAGYKDQKEGVKVGEKEGNFPPQNIPRIKIFSGG